MIGAMTFLVAVSALTSAAAWLADDGLRRIGVATRGLWLGAMVAPPLLLSAPLWMPESVASTTPLAPVFELAPILLAGPVDVGPGADMMLTGLWVVLSLWLVGILFRAQRSLARDRSRWARSLVLGRHVYVSPDRGPAVAGTVRPWIVLPEWALGLPELDLGLVMLHEEEHIRAWDSLLLGAALGLVVVTPWNPVSWWQLKRLRSAVEMDCDRRVLARAPDRERYGNSLLTVARRASGPSLGLAAFTERSLALERRIVAMTTKTTRWTPFRATLLVLLAIVVGAQACGVENPVESTDPQFDAIEVDADTEAAAEAEPAPEIVERSAEDAEAEAAPWTVAPSIQNRSEIVEAMSAEYPPLLRDAGVGGTVRVYLFVDTDGTLQRARIEESSGHQALDDAALRVASVFRFSAALNGDEPVAAWIALPITFQPPAN